MNIRIIPIAAAWLFAAGVTINAFAQTASIPDRMFSFGSPSLKGQDQTNALSIATDESPMTFSNGVWYYEFRSSARTARHEQQDSLQKMDAYGSEKIGTLRFDGKEMPVTRGPVIVDMSLPIDDAAAKNEIRKIQAERFELGNKWYLSQDEGLGIHLGNIHKHDPTLSLNPSGVDGGSFKFKFDF